MPQVRFQHLIISFAIGLSVFYVLHNHSLVRGHNKLTGNRTDRFNQETHKTSVNKVVIDHLHKCKEIPDYKLTLCHHEPKLDQVVSGQASSGHLFEKETIDRLLGWLKRDKSLGLIDLGANIGIYSLAAAGSGANVIAFEPFPPNFQLLRDSIQRSGFENRLTLIEKGVADKIYNFSMEVHKTNKGVVHLTDKINCGKSLKRIQRFIDCSVHTAQTILLDDIPKEVGNRQSFRNAILKIDIEGLEGPTILASKSFWEHYQIPVIQMEWQWFKMYFGRNKPGGKNTEALVNFLLARGYHPISDKGEKLGKDWMKWGTDIYWIKDDFQF